MFCENCGHPVSDNANFCKNCGASQKEIPHPTESANTIDEAPETPVPISHTIDRSSNSDANEKIASSSVGVPAIPQNATEQPTNIVNAKCELCGNEIPCFKNLLCKKCRRKEMIINLSLSVLFLIIPSIVVTFLEMFLSIYPGLFLTLILHIPFLVLFRKYIRRFIISLKNKKETKDINESLSEHFADQFKTNSVSSTQNSTDQFLVVGQDIPAGTHKLRAEKGEAVVFVYEKNGKAFSASFRKKRELRVVNGQQIKLVNCYIEE